MSDSSDDHKRSELARHGSLHPHPERVADPLFDRDPFFDRRDMVQVKYEMLRKVRVEGRRVNQVAADFGVSRPTYYEARAAFEESGLPGLLPAKKGPRRAHKLSDEVMEFVDELLDADASVSMVTIAGSILKRYGIKIHSRSIARALDRRSKKKP